MSTNKINWVIHVSIMDLRRINWRFLNISFSTDENFFFFKIISLLIKNGGDPNIENN